MFNGDRLWALGQLKNKRGLSPISFYFLVPTLFPCPYFLYFLGRDDDQ